MAHLSFPTVQLIDTFFNANKNLLGINPSSNFLVSQAINATLSPNLTTGGFYFEPNYFSAPTLKGNDLWGIDIPVLLQKDENKKADNLLIIIGQDPLRTAKGTIYNNYLLHLANSLKIQNNLRNYTIIGTPYAVTAHYYPDPNYKNSKNKQKEPYGKSQIYYQLIDNTLNLVKKTSGYDKKEDYDVYLTDVIKYYPNTKKANSADLQLLADEINFLCNKYSKVVILAHGNKAISAINKCSLTTSSTRIIIKTPHLSGRAGATKKWETLLSLKPVTNPNKINYIIPRL